jgi:hypothetical protein
MPLDAYITLSPRADIARDIENERVAQDRKWGQQNHLDGTGPSQEATTVDGLSLLSPVDMANLYRDLCDQAARDGRLTWRHILLEEVFEALAEDDPAKLRIELVQSAAVITAWIEALDRRVA